MPCCTSAHPVTEGRVQSTWSLFPPMSHGERVPATAWSLQPLGPCLGDARSSRLAVATRAGPASSLRPRPGPSMLRQGLAGQGECSLGRCQLALPGSQGCVDTRTERGPGPARRSGPDTRHGHRPLPRLPSPWPMSRPLALAAARFSLQPGLHMRTSRLVSARTAHCVKPRGRRGSPRGVLVALLLLCPRPATRSLPSGAEPQVALSGLSGASAAPTMQQVTPRGAQARRRRHSERRPDLHSCLFFGFL